MLPRNEGGVRAFVFALIHDYLLCAYSIVCASWSLPRLFTFLIDDLYYYSIGALENRAERSFIRRRLTRLNASVNEFDFEKHVTADFRRLNFEF